MIALGLSFVFAAFAAFVSTRLILNRLQATVSTLNSVREGDLSRRVPEDDAGDAFAEALAPALELAGELRVHLEALGDREKLISELQEPVRRDGCHDRGARIRSRRVRAAGVRRSSCFPR